MPRRGASVYGLSSRLTIVFQNRVRAFARTEDVTSAFIELEETIFEEEVIATVDSIFRLTYDQLISEDPWCSQYTNIDATIIQDNRLYWRSQLLISLQL